MNYQEHDELVSKLIIKVLKETKRPPPKVGDPRAISEHVQYKRGVESVVKILQGAKLKCT